MSQFLLLVVVALVVGGIVFGVAALVTGSDPGLVDVDADVRAVPLPEDRDLDDADVAQLRFDTALRGYRADQVDAAIERLGADLSRKRELIGLLEAEITALREGRIVEANQLRQARESKSAPEVSALPSTVE